VCGACEFQFYRNPAVATAALITDDQGRVLLTRRSRDPARGKLGMPGGFVDFGETAEAGLRREVREEIGLELDNLCFLTSWPNDYHYGGILYPTVDLFFVSRVPSFSAARPLSEVAGLEVCDPRSLAPADMAFDSMRHALRVFCAEQAR
jgi:8-oxo-dGTP pyrophosphatase MutT (NUDIX family)